MSRITLLLDIDAVDKRLAELCWDLPELARQSGLSRGTLIGLLAPDQVVIPRRSTIRKIAAALNVSAVSLTRQQAPHVL